MIRNTLGLISENGQYTYVQQGLLDRAIKEARAQAFKKAIVQAADVTASPVYLCSSDDDGRFCLPYPEYEDGGLSTKRFAWDGCAESLLEAVLTLESSYPGAAVIYATGAFSLAASSGCVSNTFQLSSWALILWRRNTKPNQTPADSLITKDFEE